VAQARVRSRHCRGTRHTPDPRGRFRRR
jgi:hypothetical protein